MLGGDPDKRRLAADLPVIFAAGRRYFAAHPDVTGAGGDRRPANGEAAKAFLQKNRKGPDRIMEYLQHAAPRPLSPRYLQVSDIEVNLAQDIFAGTDPQAAADKACQAIDRLE